MLVDITSNTFHKCTATFQTSFLIVILYDECLLDEYDKEENVKVIGTAAPSCLKRII
jgi:hypothetical protein